MPTNLAENALSALKVGNDNVTAAYVGNSQIFPNTTEITYWTGQEGRYNYPDYASSVWTTDVTGPAGATFNLVGSNGITTQTGLVKSVDGVESFSYTTEDNSGCDTTTRTLSLQIVPTGNTTLNLDIAGGSFPATDTGANGTSTNPMSPQPATQQGSGNVTQTINTAGTWTTSVQNPGNYVVVNNQKKWLDGTIVDFTFTIGNITNNQGGTAGVGQYWLYPNPAFTNSTITNFSNTMGISNPTAPTAANGGNWYTSGVSISNQIGQSMSGTFTLGNNGQSSATFPFISFYVYQYATGLTGNGGCYNISPMIGTIHYEYP